MRPIQRCGFTTVELIIAMAIAGLLIASAFGIVAKHQRIYSTLGTVLQTSPKRTDLTTLLGADIRTMTVYPGSVSEDSALFLRATLGTSVVCAAASRTTLTLPPHTSKLAASLTSYATLPEPGDVVLIYQDGRWTEHELSTIATTTSSDCTNQLGDTVANQLTTLPAIQLTLSPATTTVATPGTPVRFARLVRYNVYKASDNEWYIGYRRCSSPSACDGVQPVIGPLGDRHDKVAPLTFRYFDATGRHIPSDSRLDGLARVEIILRQPKALIPLLAKDSSQADSLIATFALRNAK